MNNLKKFFKNHRLPATICSALAVCLIALAVYFLFIKESNDYESLADNALLTSGKYEMRYDEAFFLTKNKQAYYEAYYLTADKDLDWNKIYEDNKTFSQLVLEESLDFTKEIFIFSEYAKANGITLSQSELDAIDKDVSTFLSESGTKVLNATKANADILKRVYTRTAYHDKLCEKIYNETDLTVNEDELRQCLIAAVELGPKYFDSPDETAKAIMEEVNSGQVITEVAKKYDTQARKGNIGKGTMDGNALEKLALSLKIGECKTTKIDDTYFVVYCYLEYDEEATDYAVEQKIEELKAEAVATYFENLLKEMPIVVDEKAWSTITFDKPIFTKDDIKTTEQQ